MQAIAHRMPAAIEADVFQRTTAQMRVEPGWENSLTCLAEMPRARDHAAAVDSDRKIKRLCIFQRDGFARKFAGSMKFNWRHGENVSLTPSAVNPSGKFAPALGRKAR
jgi:hypothetical protein